MINGNDYDLSRLAYREWNEQFQNLYVPVQERHPGVVRRLFAALRTALAERAAQSGARHNTRQAQAGAGVK